MSSDGSSPEYDFSLGKASQLPHFDPDRIAEQAVWPTVDHLSYRDWRQDSYAGQDWNFPGMGVGLHEKAIFDINLSANCIGSGPADPEEDSEIELRHTTIVQIEKVATVGLRDVVFHRAHKAKPELMEGLAGYSGLIAKTGVAYAFDTDEPAEVNAFQAIETPSGIVLWVSEKFDEAEIEDMSDDLEPEIDEGDEIVFDIDRFHRHDVDNIITALSILGAPERCIRALNIIKGQPIADEVGAEEE